MFFMLFNIYLGTDAHGEGGPTSRAKVGIGRHQMKNWDNPPAAPAHFRARESRVSDLKRVNPLTYFLDVVTEFGGVLQGFGGLQV